EEAVVKGKEYIKAGDIFQFVPSQRLRVQSEAQPFDVYRALRIINPSPFMFFLKSPACVLIGSSPEILCRVMDGHVTSRPLAGTRRRGAPKVRAMQIIDELETTRRGPYGGAVGYLDFAGNMDTCIALRTMVWKNGVYDVQAGAGVVADSVPASEYEETMSKAKALLKA